MTENELFKKHRTNIHHISGATWEVLTAGRFHEVYKEFQSQLEHLRKENEDIRNKILFYDITVLPEKDAEYQRSQELANEALNVAKNFKHHAEEMAKAIENTLNGQFFPAELQQALTNFREGNK